MNNEARGGERSGEYVREGGRGQENMEIIIIIIMVMIIMIKAPV